MNNELNEKHEQAKKKIKIIAFFCIFIGLVLTIIGFVDFFTSVANNTMPSLFFMLFIGFPLLGIGISLLAFGFRKEIMRYNKNESVPIINEASDEISPTINNIAKAFKNTSNVTCPFCHEANDKDSKFCKNCGHSLINICPNCQNEVDSDAIYCNHCGKKLKWIMKYKLVMFDLDGTVLDTINDLTNSMNYILSLHSMPLHTADEIKQYLGNGIRKLVESSVSKNTNEKEINQIYNEFLSYYKLHSLDETKPFDGIIDLLYNLKKSGCILAMISNKADVVVQQLSQKFFNNLFDYVSGEKANIKKKPYPDIIFEVMKKFNIDNENSIYIGDTEVDSLTAINANIDSIIVTWGFRKKEFLETLKKTYLVDDVNDIYKIIANG